MIINMRRQYNFIVFGITVFLLVHGPFEFSAAAEEKSISAESIRRDVERQAFDEAMGAFNARDYARAKLTFEMLSESARNPEIRRVSLFGLASVKFILAGAPSEYEDALSSWKKWMGESGSGESCSKDKCEDPAMITPFLQRLQSSIASSSCIVSAAKSRRAAKEIDPKGILQNKEKEMQALRFKLDMREREIRRLRHQLESIEQIHREYQEKKLEATP